MLNYSKAPNSSGEAFQRFIEEGIPTGSFLEALLSNDLAQACARADYINQALIFEYTHFMWDELPLSAWGSRENYKNWIAHVNKIKQEGNHEKFLKELEETKSHISQGGI